MGSHFQTVVDLDATPADARALAELGLGWLVREGIVRAGMTPCVLGAPLGHPPGDSWASAVAEADWEPTDGLRIEAPRRTVFDGGQGEPRYARCPHCAYRVELLTGDWDPVDGAWDPFDAAIEAWRATGLASVACPGCGRDGELAAWGWEGDHFAFGCLGFEFWDWPEFSPAFLERFARALGGHRLVVVGGKF
ncbi:hypothetical protein [Streptomyces sp. NPDC059708]|uniref:hypothetical protein n=1 Tax=Streptomyces sp. NPDC059708 TaxID=3346916 RepID=UPI00368F90E8